MTDPTLVEQAGVIVPTWRDNNVWYTMGDLLRMIRVSIWKEWQERHQWAVVGIAFSTLYTISSLREYLFFRGKRI